MRLYQSAKVWAVRVWVGLAWLMALAAGCHCPRAGAAPPLLEFDVPFFLCCRAVAGNGPAQAGPTRDLVEVVVPISVRVQAGSEKDLRQCLYTLADSADAPELTARDWLPRTELKTEYAKPIQVNKERHAKLGVAVSAHYAAAASGDAMGELKSGTAYEMLPPQEVVLASGTVHDGHGVFFKLRPSSQTALEGMRSFSAVFAVPHGWRGGCLTLRCEALGLDRGLVRKLDREVRSGRAVFGVALYLAGDARAEALAGQVAAREQELIDCLDDPNSHRDAAGHKPLPLLRRWTRLPNLWEQHSARGSDAAALIECALDRSAPHASSAAEYSPPVWERLRAFQEAAEALHQYSAASVRLAAGVEPARRAQPAQLQPPAPNGGTGAGTLHLKGSPVPSARPSGAVAPASGPHERGAAAAARPAAAGGEPTAAAASPKPRAPQSGAVPGGANPGPDARAAAPAGATGSEALNAEPAPPEPPGRSWYFLASVGGALFTCILAPVVVEVVRARINNRARAAAEKREQSTPAAQRAACKVTPPLTRRTPRASRCGVR